MSRAPETVTAARVLVLGLFLFSGVSGLIYEVVWSRMFTLVLGSTVYAVSTVLGVFMGGLALGSWLFGRVADRPGVSGLRIYAWLEFGIGGFALVLPGLMALSNALYRAAWPNVADSFAGVMAVRLLLAGAILVVPSTLMGGTLPVLSRFLVRSRTRTGVEIGGLYAINTLGATLGSLLAGFVLLEQLGVRASMLAAAALNFAVGLAALRRSYQVVHEGHVVRSEPVPENVRHYAPGQIRLALVLYAFSGFAALALEVLWTRSLLYFTSVDTYAFTAMLAAFLCGLGLGSLVMSPFVGRIREPLLVLGVIEALIGITAAASVPLLGSLYGVFTAVAGALPPATLLTKLVTKLACSFMVMLVPTLLMGAAFPVVSAIYVGSRRQVGQRVGTLYALNTVGAIVGSTTAGFMLIPSLGLERSILLCASVYVALGLLLCAVVPRTVPRRVVALAGVTVVIAAVAVGNARFEGAPMVLHSRFFEESRRAHRLVACHEDSAASLVVLENSNGTRLLNINGITTAINNHLDMQVHRMLAHLPILLHPEPETVLVVGFGMGSTPWGCCQHPEVQRVDVVELLRSEKRTACHFEDINHGVLGHPKLRFIEGDGRNYLLATRRQYDVISFNAIHPRYSAYLYTRDFYELCRERMTADGVVCAWMTQNSMTETEFRMLCRSFVDVFPHSSLWYCNPEHFCLLGTMLPTRIDLRDWERRITDEEVQRDLADSNLSDPFVLVGRHMLSGTALADYVAGAPLNTDDRPRIEFARETRAEQRAVVERLIARVEPPTSLLVNAVDGDGRLARHLEAAGHVMRGQLEHWYPRDGGSLKPEIAFRRALLACPESEDVRHNLVFSRSIKRDLANRLRADPNHVGALTRAGVVLLEEGRLGEAEDHLKRALQIHNQFVPAARWLGLVHLLSGNVRESSRWLQGVLRAGGEHDPRTQFALSVALEQLGQSREAADLRASAVAVEPDVAEWFALLSDTVELMQTHRAAATARGRF